MSYTVKEIERWLHANPDLAIMGNGTISAPVANVTRQPQVAKLSEHDVQVAVIAECQRRAETNPDWQMIFAIPNGGHRHPAVAGKLKAEGVQAGLPDLCCPLARHSRHSLWLELKVGKNQLSPSQEFWVRRLRVEGHCVEVVHDDPQAAINIIHWYLEK